MINMKKRTNGFTLVELIVAITIMAIITPVMSMVLFYVIKGFSSYEAINSINKKNQEMLNRIYMRMSVNKRIFQNTSSDNQFLSRIQLTNCPSVLANSKLAKIEEGGSLSPDTTTFIAASAGNSLFFGSYEFASTFNNVADSDSSTHTVKIDLYRFYYYYITADNPHSITSRPSYRGIEWKSIPYVDYRELINITNSTLRSNTVKKIYAAGIRYGWDPAATVASGSFYSLNSNGNITLQSAHNIQKDKYIDITKIATGIMGSAYRYGVSPNTAGWPQAPLKIPEYGITNGSFPGGFETVIVGSSRGRKVLVRSSIVAQIMTSYVTSQLTIVCSARDVW
ncbi:MAG: hypothetical protein BWY26_01639 [Elusimicrobia bacterium ADurb.Bin231]|nr:MAG: hypothetical protein BWY26_01639 [Elusimicrobia bacterium ADurb.Bin231]